MSTSTSTHTHHSGMRRIPLVTRGGSEASRPSKSHASNSTQIHYLTVPPKMNDPSLRALLEVVLGSRGKVLVFQGDNENNENGVFCDGLDLSARDATLLGDADMAWDEIGNGLDLLVEFSEALKAHDMPIICAIRGSCRGGGMLFPSRATIVCALEGAATFGFPEVRVGMLPGVISVAARERIQKIHLKRLMSLGKPFGVQEAQRLGFVDEVRQQKVCVCVSLIV